MTVDRKIINDMDFQGAQKVKNAVDGVDPQDYATVAQLGGFVPDPSGEPDNKWLKTSSGALIYVDPPAGGSIDVTDGITTVSPASSVDFTSGATVTDGGSGLAEVAIVIPTSLPPNGSAGGDLGSTYPNPTVIALHETGGPTKLTLGSVPDGDYLVRSGSTLVGGSPTPGGPPTGAAGGDLSGTYPNPDVAKVNGVAVTSVMVKRYLSKPAGNITRAATTVGAFSTAWQITGVVVAAGQNVKLTMSCNSISGTANNDQLFAFFRASTQLASRIFTGTAAATHQGREFTWVDENPGAGTYTYEIQAAMFTGGTLTVYQTNITTDTGGGGSIFIAEVYKP